MAYQVYIPQYLKDYMDATSWSSVGIQPYTTTTYSGADAVLVTPSDYGVWDFDAGGGRGYVGSATIEGDGDQKKRDPRLANGSTTSAFYTYDDQGTATLQKPGMLDANNNTPVEDIPESPYQARQYAGPTFADQNVDGSPDRFQTSLTPEQQANFDNLSRMTPEERAAEFERRTAEGEDNLAAFQATRAERAARQGIDLNRPNVEYELEYDENGRIIPPEGSIQYSPWTTDENGNPVLKSTVEAQKSWQMIGENGEVDQTLDPSWRAMQVTTTAAPGELADMYGSLEGASGRAPNGMVWTTDENGNRVFYAPGMFGLSGNWVDRDTSGEFTPYGDYAAKYMTGNDDTYGDRQSEFIYEGEAYTKGVYGFDQPVQEAAYNIARKLGMPEGSVERAAFMAAKRAMDKHGEMRDNDSGEPTRAYAASTNPYQIVQWIADEMGAMSGQEIPQLFSPEKMAEGEKMAKERIEASKKAFKQGREADIRGAIGGMLGVIGPAAFSGLGNMLGGGLQGQIGSKLIQGVLKGAVSGDLTKGLLGSLPGVGMDVLKASGGLDGLTGMLGGDADLPEGDLVGEIGDEISGMSTDDMVFYGDHKDPLEALIAARDAGLNSDEALKFVEQNFAGSTNLGDAAGMLNTPTDFGDSPDAPKDDLAAEVDEIMGETTPGTDFNLDQQMLSKILKLGKLAYGIVSSGDSGGGQMPQPKQAPPTPPAPDAPPEEQAPYQEALVEYLGLDPETMANAGVEIGTQEYLDYILEQANAIIEQIFGADPSALLEGDSIEGLQDALKSKTEDEMERLMRALYIRGQTGTTAAYEGKVYDPFTDQKYESGMIGGITDPDVAGYMRGLAGQVDVLGGMRGDQARSVLGGLLERNPDIYGLQRAMDVRKMRELLAAAIEDEKKRKKYGESSSGKAWQDLFEERAKQDPKAIQALLEEVTGGDTARQGRLVEALFGWEQN